MLLLLWIILGAGLRLADLDLKPPWTDEFDTLVVSLGNSVNSVPLDRVISFQDLLAPLIPNSSTTVGDIIDRVFLQDRHPPMYFALAHLWMQLFPPDGGLVSLWGARALPAAIGIVTIPILYICSYAIFRSPLVAQLTAGMFAVSPYGVYIAQEARHYSLAILWVTISISCLAIAVRSLDLTQKLPFYIIAIWIVVNNFAMATNYLSSVALVTELIVLALFGLWQIRQAYTKAGANESYLAIAGATLRHPSWQRLALAILGTTMGIVTGWWLLTHPDTPVMISWLDNSPHKSIEIVNPLFQIIGAAITMMSLLLVEVNELPPISLFSELPLDLSLPIIIISAILMLIFFVWAIPMLYRGIGLQPNISTIAIGGFVAIAIGLYLVIPWLTGIDITRGARYHFVYFPALMLLVGLGLASCWQSVPSIAKWVSGKQAVAIVLLMGLVSSTIVTSNYGYHKYYRPEQLVPLMQQSAPLPILIATTHNSLLQVGEMMGVAWELRRTDTLKQAATTKFLLAHQFQRFCEPSTARLSQHDCPTTKILRETIDRIAHPIDLWAIDFYAPISLPPTCEADKKFTEGIYGYQYRLYHCQPIKDLD